MNPRLFIGSSIEGLQIAYAIQESLEHDPVDVTVWTQGFFHLSQSTLSGLIKGLSKYDIGVFVLTPDDLVTIRSKEFVSARDNVIFELGLFFGAMGQDRAFYVIPRSEKSFRLPTDLLGITAGTYDDNREDNNLTAALGTFSNQVRNAVWNLELKPSEVSEVSVSSGGQKQEQEVVPVKASTNISDNKDIDSFYNLYEKLFMPVYANLVAAIGDKPIQIIIEQENALAHIVRANTNPDSFELNMKKAASHILRATLNSLKLLWLRKKELIDRYLNAEKGIWKRNKKPELKISDSEFMKKYKEAENVLRVARKKELSGIDADVMDTIDSYYKAVQAYDELLQAIPDGK